MKAKTIYLIAILFTIHYSLFIPSALAQGVKSLIQQHPSYASCNYHVYPDSITAVLTPAPAGKKPFYISHYGRHGSRYINSRSPCACQLRPPATETAALETQK